MRYYRRLRFAYILCHPVRMWVDRPRLSLPRSLAVGQRTPPNYQYLSQLQSMYQLSQIGYYFRNIRMEILLSISLLIVGDFSAHHSAFFAHEICFMIPSRKRLVLERIISCYLSLLVIYFNLQFKQNISVFALKCKYFQNLTFHAQLQDGIYNFLSI